jgi:hypothetical protein
MPASLPPSFYEASQKTRLRGRERMIAGGLAAFLLAIVVITLLSFGSTNKVGRGCIDVNVPGAFGTDVLKACGTDAREICTQLKASTDLTSDDVTQISAACRAAGLPVKHL